MSIHCNLRDSLLATLANLPGVREFHLHVLISSPRKSASLFPFARPRPRAYLQDILILLSEQETPDSPSVLVTAIEASVFHIPATSCAVFYVSKVDSTGQNKGKSPMAALVRGLLSFYANPITRPIAADHLWIQLFARAQAQYLFSNSAEFPGKRPLSDVKLCAWWKRVLSQVGGEMEAALVDKSKVNAFYVLPGYSELEAENALRIASSTAPPLATSISWQYGHPYTQPGIPLPCSLDSPEKGSNLGNYIPYFDDDPKSRFLDEIAYTTGAEGIKSPARKRSRTASHSDLSGTQYKETTNEKSSQNGKDDRPLGELGKVTADEFWERMSFRQECVAGAVTGFFTLIISSATPSSPSTETNTHRSAISPLAPQPGQVSSQVNKRIMTSLLTGVEFSTLERSIRATETLASAIKGLCEGIAVVPTSVGAGTGPTIRGDLGRRTPEPEPSSHPSLLVPPSTPPPRFKHGGAILPEVSPNPFPEPVASLETYHSHIYGSIAISNPVPVSANDMSNGSETVPHVTVLTVRKKKKRTE